MREVTTWSDVSMFVMCFDGDPNKQDQGERARW